MRATNRILIRANHVDVERCTQYTRDMLLGYLGGQMEVFTLTPIYKSINKKVSRGFRVTSDDEQDWLSISNGLRMAGFVLM